MGNPPDNQNNVKAAGFKRYFSKRIIVALVLIAVVVWAFSSIPKSGDRGEPQRQNRRAEKTHAAPSADTEATGHASAENDKKAVSEDNGRNDAADAPPRTDAEASHTPPPPSTEAAPPLQEDDAVKAEHSADAEPSEGDAPHATAKETGHGVKPDPHDQTSTEPDEHDPAPHDATAEPDHSDPDHKNLPTGVAFADATIKPLEFELNERFWGWRPNDIVNLTDNVNNFQLGVLEVTRRTVVLLAESISRTGTTDAFNPHLENAMNWLMVRSSRYWFPSPESKYKESLEEVKAYRDALMDGSGSFYTRADNLIPLLLSYENLLGSCDENLVKQKNGDGSKVSLFKADDYFFYAKGVANSLATVLEAVHHDFLETLESRHASDLLHHALASCRQAAALDPLLITNGDLDGILSNHRANMAAPISHARFYISQMIKTLST